MPSGTRLSTASENAKTQGHRQAMAPWLERFQLRHRRTFTDSGKLETMPQVGTPELVQDVCFQAVLDGTWTIADWEEYQLEKQARKERELNDSKKQQ